MQASITVRRLTLASAFKVVVLGNVLSVVLYLVLVGVLSFLGLPSLELTSNNQPISGVGAIAFAGLWLYSLLRPLEIFYPPGIRCALTLQRLEPDA